MPTYLGQNILSICKSSQFLIQLALSVLAQLETICQAALVLIQFSGEQTAKNTDSELIPTRK